MTRTPISEGSTVTWVALSEGSDTIWSGSSWLYIANPSGDRYADPSGNLYTVSQ